MSVGAFAELAHARDRRGRPGERGVAVVAGGTGLYLRAALADLDVPPAVAPAVRARIGREVDDDRGAAHRRLAELDAPAAAAVHPTIASGWSVRSNWRRRGGRSWRGRTALGRSHAPADADLGLDVGPDVLERRIRERTEAMFARGVVDEVRAALRGRCRRPRRRPSASRRSQSSSRRPTRGSSSRTLRYAAYQRKWMRRIPGLVPVDASGPPRDRRRDRRPRSGSLPRCASRSGMRSGTRTWSSSGPMPAT